ncbi:MAG TPA: hypothetical protein VNF46_02850 [Gammaproteobacteria bacterium]|nr:hypothetical protein [Gammaproteobacteria bacterium]
MAKKHASRGRAKAAKKAAPKARKARHLAKTAKKAAPRARKPSRAKAAKARTPVQIKNELHEQYVIDQGNIVVEDYFNSSGSEHFGITRGARPVT